MPLHILVLKGSRAWSSDGSDLHRNSWWIRFNTVVLLSEHDTALASETRTDVYRVAAIHRHPDFRPPFNNLDGDLALLLLSGQVHFRPELSPACLPQPGELVELCRGEVIEITC